MDLKDKTALITGGGTGVGRATATQLSKLGCNVVINYSRSKQAAEETAQSAIDNGVDALAIQADVANDSDCKTLIDTTIQHFSQLDYLINNAGVTYPVPLPDLDAIQEQHWDHILGVNLRGPFQMARAASAALRKSDDAAIVNVSSVAGIAGIGSSLVYCTSKAGLNMLTTILARVLGPEIRVNAVAPGFIDGEWLQGVLGDAYEAVKSGMEQRVPLKRVCTPDDVAAAILSLLTGSRLVSGQILAVEGGLLSAG